MTYGTEDGRVCSRPAVDDGKPCIGDMHFPPSENCSCHISPPCGSCTSVLLTCDVCGWQEGDEEPAEQVAA